MQRKTVAHDLITSYLWKCFEKAKVFPDKPVSYNRVACSRIKFSIIIELVSLGEDSLDSIAHCYSKHGIKVCKKHYIQFFSNTKATELSWKSYERCRTLTKEEKKASNTHLKLLVKKTIKKWYKDFKSYHKVHFNVNVTDKGLEEILERFQHERTLRKDG